MTSDLPEIQLESYLRLNRASLEEWLAGLRTVYSFERLKCTGGASQEGVGALSALQAEGGDLACIYASQDMEIAGGRAEHLSLVVPLEGVVEFASDSLHWSRLNNPAVVPAATRFNLSLSAGSQVMYLALSSAERSRLVDDGQYGCLSDVNCLVTNYLFRAGFFLDDGHARAMTRDLFRSLKAKFETGQAIAVPDRPEPDRRLIRVIRKIQLEPNWESDLHELASHSGVSERNLFYLMKRETGMTPYRFFQRCRLLRVRRRLVDCRCELPHISWYAADEGFSHLGRFAALYRRHFGELPSETVQWRRNLLVPAGLSAQDEAVG